MTYQPLHLFFNFLNHLIHPFLGQRNQFNLKKHKILYLLNFILWIFLIPIKLIEILGLSYLIHFLFSLTIKSRPLTEFEKQDLKLIFKDSIKYDAIRINETSRWAKIGAKSIRKKHMGFVFLYTINFTRALKCKTVKTDMQWLVHETTHIAQFNKLGLQYILEALIAQQYGGYNFGSIKNAYQNPLNYFNLEQQAEIIKHIYYQTKHDKLLENAEKIKRDLLVGKF